MNIKNIALTVSLVLLFIGLYWMYKYTSTPSNIVNAPQPTQTDSNWPTQQQSSKNLNGFIDFTLKDLNGNNITLSSLRGKKVFLNFWATWCPPCRSEMPDIERIYKKYKDSDVYVLTVNVNEPHSTVKKFIDEYNYSFPVVLDDTGEVSQKYQITGIPTSYFIDSDGNISDKHVGALTFDDMEKYILAIDK